MIVEVAVHLGLMRTVAPPSRGRLARRTRGRDAFGTAGRMPALQGAATFFSRDEAGWREVNN
jgi:hypothetical protein